MPACLPCYLRQVQSVLEVAGADEETAYQVFAQVLPMLGALDREKTPAENSTLVLLRAYAALGQGDPFRAARAASNRQAWEWLARCERRATKAKDPLLFALKVAAAGNIVDLGILKDFDLGASVAEVEAAAFARLDYDALKYYLEKAKQVLVVGDNSGEIVLDRLLLRTLGREGRRVLYAVKAGPVLNDATRQDAAEARLGELAEVIDTGSNYLGVVEGHYSREFGQAMAESGLVIAKGQANYETLEGTLFAGTKTFFLLRAKCAVIAAHLGVPPMAAVLVQNRPRQGG